MPIGEVRHATLHLADFHDRLDFPITIVKRQGAVSLTKTCEPTELEKGEKTECVIEMTNTSFDTAAVRLRDHVPSELEVQTVSGASGRRVLTFEGNLAGAQPPNVTAVVDPLASPFGYVPLAAFGIPPIAASDESLANFGIPAVPLRGRDVRHDRRGLERIHRGRRRNGGRYRLPQYELSQPAQAEQRSRALLDGPGSRIGRSDSDRRADRRRQRLDGRGMGPRSRTSPTGNSTPVRSGSARKRTPSARTSASTMGPKSPTATAPP